MRFQLPHLGGGVLKICRCLVPPTVFLIFLTLANFYFSSIIKRLNTLPRITTTLNLQAFLHLFTSFKFQTKLSSSSLSDPFSLCL